MHLLLNSAGDLGVGESKNPSRSLSHGLNCTKQGMNIWQHSPESSEYTTFVGKY